MIRWSWSATWAVLEGLAVGTVLGLGADRALDAIGAAIGLR